MRDPDELCDLLALPEDFRYGARRAARLFPLVVPRDFLALMEPGNPKDPLLRQILPVTEEEDIKVGFGVDPVGDLANQTAAGLLQKYHGRALFVTTGLCAVNCRFCFRRHFPYKELPREFAEWEPALKLLAVDTSIREVILSGGDPLTLTDDRLARLAAELSEIKHIKRLRIHSRLPIVLPSRIDDRLLAWLTGIRLQPIMVVHANHPNELGAGCSAAIARLVDSGVLVLNQAVLLRGVNDDVHTLEKLSSRLIDLRVIPYYIHQLDSVRGAAHFEVPEREGLDLIERLRSRLPGYAVPRYVREVEGETGKTVME